MPQLSISAALQTNLRGIEHLSDIVQAMHAEMRPDVFRMPVEPEGRRSFFEHALSDPAWHLWVCEENTQLVGYILAERMIKDGAIRTPHVEGHIHQICVDPAHRRCGVGRTMVQHACQFFQTLGVDRITVAYWNFNAASQALFQSTGFRPAITTAEYQTP